MDDLEFDESVQGSVITQIRMWYNSSKKPAANMQVKFNNKMYTTNGSGIFDVGGQPFGQYPIEYTWNGLVRKTTGSFTSTQVPLPYYVPEEYFELDLRSGDNLPWDKALFLMTVVDDEGTKEVRYQWVKGTKPTGMMPVFEYHVKAYTTTDYFEFIIPASADLQNIKVSGKMPYKPGYRVIADMRYTDGYLPESDMKFALEDSEGVTSDFYDYVTDNRIDIYDAAIPTNMKFKTGNNEIIGITTPPTFEESNIFLGTIAGIPYTNMVAYTANSSLQDVIGCTLWTTQDLEKKFQEWDQCYVNIDHLRYIRTTIYAEEKNIYNEVRELEVQPSYVTRMCTIGGFGGQSGSILVTGTYDNGLPAVGKEVKIYNSTGTVYLNKHGYLDYNGQTIIRGLDIGPIIARIEVLDKSFSSEITNIESGQTATASITGITHPKGRVAVYCTYSNGDPYVGGIIACFIDGTANKAALDAVTDIDGVAHFTDVMAATVYFSTVFNSTPYRSNSISIADDKEYEAAIQGIQHDSAKLLWKGQWRPNQEYAKADIVGWQGSAWISLDIVDSDVPPNDDKKFWEIFAEKGADSTVPGPKGDSIKGDKGDPGESIKGDKGDPGQSIKGDPGVSGSDGASITIGSNDPT